MGQTLGPPGSCRPQMGLMLAPWTLLSGYCYNSKIVVPHVLYHLLPHLRIHHPRWGFCRLYDSCLSYMMWWYIRINEMFIEWFIVSTQLVQTHVHMKTCVCVRSRYQWQGQVSTSQRYCGILCYISLPLIPASDTHVLILWYIKVTK